MPAGHFLSVVPALRTASFRRWGMFGLGVAFVAGSTFAVYDFLTRRHAADPAAELSAATRRANLETCTEGAHMFHDVRWAAVCMVLAQHDPFRDGSTECELPEVSAARLYELLHAAEQRCFAEFRAPPGP